MLANSPVSVAIPCVDLAGARAFYGQTLGLTESTMSMPSGPDGTPIGAAFQCGGGTMLFVYTRETPTQADHTVAGWFVDDIDAAAEELISRGVTFEVYEGMPGTEWDDRGVAYSDDGSKSAWFKDPEGSILSINMLPG